MFADERKALIRKAVMEEGTISIAKLAERFEVSTETIRRDLRQLSLENKIVKVHGGAIAVDRPVREEEYDIRVKKHLDAKIAIAKHAASLIENGDVIALDYGTSAEEIARAIYNVHNITVITNSFNCASILIEKSKREDFTGKIIFIGGAVDVNTSKTIGEFALSSVDYFYLDKAFICTTSVSVSGVMMWEEREGEYSAALARKAAEVYVIADSSKFDKESFYRFLTFDQVDTIITDDENEMSNALRNKLNEKGINLQIVNVEKQ